jgi:galactokinase
MATNVLHRGSTASQLALSFQQKFETNAARIFRAPGRVNLIGEHTDYNDGFVMPAAIDFHTSVAAAKRPDRAIHAYSEHYDETISFTLDDLAPDQADHASGHHVPRHHWSNFIRGIAAVLQKAGYPLTGANLAIHGDIPLGAGLSSSASLEVAAAMALTHLAAIEVDRLDLAKVCRSAEHEYVGTRCGIMDQFAVSFGVTNHALMLDCRSLEYKLLPLPPDLRLVICNSMVRHELASSEYNLRCSDCETGVKLLQPHLPGINALRDVEICDLERFAYVLPDRIFRRCRHVITENQRVLQAARALKTNDAEQFGELMYQSHRSLRDDYEVSCKEVNLLVELASAYVGVYGARMTGGGFGGCTVNLVRADCAAAFQTQIAQAYHSKTGIEPPVYICHAVEGAAEWADERTPGRSTDEER